MLVHFTAKPGLGAELERRLREIGFDNVRKLPDGQRIVLAADANELSRRLGLAVHYKERDKLLGRHRTTLRQPVISDVANLLPQIAELVDKCYAPLAPDRLAKPARG